MEKSHNIGSERGVALVTVVLMTTLVVGLIALVITNSKVGSIVTATYVTERQNEECGHGNLKMAEALFIYLAEEGQSGLQTSKRGNENELIYDPTLLSEINEGMGTVTGATKLNVKVSVDEDTATNTPDITILPKPTSSATAASATPERNCQTNVDIDLLYSYESEDKSPQVSQSKHIKGVLCPDGLVYSINTVSRNMKTNVARSFRSAYYMCPETS